jgi:hypothetical protein
MKASLILIAVATLCLPACTTNDGTSKTTNMGPGAVAGPSAGWSAGSGGFGNVGRDSGSGIRGNGIGAGTSGATGTGWIENAPRR